VDRVVPVVVVDSGNAVPATVRCHERRMIPIVTGILPAHHNALAGIADGPHVWSVYISQIRLDRLRPDRSGAQWIGRGYRQRILDVRVALDACYLGARRQRQRQVSVAFTTRRLTI